MNTLYIISIAITLLVIQHLLNWGWRKTIDFHMEHDNPASATVVLLMCIATILSISGSIGLFKLIIVLGN